MGAINILSTEDLLRSANIIAQRTKTITWRGNSIVIKDSLPLQEYLGLVHKVVEDSTNDGHILYELVDFAMRVNIIATYSFINLPKDAYKLYDIVYRTDLYDTIVSEIDRGQLRNVFDAVFMYTGVRSDDA